MWLAVAVFAVAVGYLAVIAFTYWNDSHRYDEISDTAFTVEEGQVSPLADMKVDWDALRAINPEVVAWVYIPDTPVSYPVCYSGDNEKYLNMNFDGAQGVFTGSGTIFLDKNCNPQLTNQNLVLYGHHMNDGSMFACLSGFADPAEFEGHRDIYLLTPQLNMRFKSFALVRTDGSDALVTADFPLREQMVEYVADKQQRSIVQPEGGFPDPAAVTQMITLSTCDYNQADGRAVLFGNLEESAAPAQGGSQLVGGSEGYVSPEPAAEEDADTPAEETWEEPAEEEAA